MPSLFSISGSSLQVTGEPCPPSEPGDQALLSAQTAIAAIARTARMSPAGVEALSRWTCWVAYATQQAKDPHQLAWPAWRAVLPVDRDHAPDNLMRVLLRAGEPKKAAREAAELAYRQENFLAGDMQPYKTYEPLLGIGTPRLPGHAAMFETLPTWGKEMALSAANLTGKDLVMILELRGLRLSWLRAYFVNFGDLDLSGCDFSHADLRGASLRHAMTEHAVFDHAMRGDAPSLQARCWPGPGWAPRPASIEIVEIGKKSRTHGAASFLLDEEILHVLPFQFVEQHNGIEVARMEDGKVVIQQYGLSGSAAAVAAMLVADHGRPFDAHAVRAGDAASNNDIRRDIERANLEAITKGVDSIETLAEQIAKDGPAKVSVADKELGWHQVIIDDVDMTRSRARLRDPFHGWGVIIPLQALTCRLHFPTAMIQAAAWTSPRRRPGPWEIRIWEPDALSPGGAHKNQKPPLGGHRRPPAPR